MTRLSPRLALALMLLPLASPGRAETATPPATAAYPDNPSGTPATTTNGTAPAAAQGQAGCSTGASCPLSPAAPAGPATGDVPQPGRVATPTAAYPDSPIKTPAAAPSGTAPK